MIYQFYMAASWSTKDETRSLAYKVEKICGGDWECNSSWLYAPDQPTYSEQDLLEIAAEDLNDLERAEAFVMNLAPYMSVGKYTELGYAIALKKPIFLYGTELQSRDSCPFFHIYDLITWAPPNAGSVHIANFLTMEGKR